MINEQEYFDRLTLELNGLNPDCVTLQKHHDANWEKLKQEQHQPYVEQAKAIKMANCTLSVWYDSDNLSVRYDVAYDDGNRVNNKRLNGIWSNEDGNKESVAIVLDAIQTMIARTDNLDTCKISKFYNPNEIKSVVDEFRFIKVTGIAGQFGWFVFNDKVYQARLEEFDTKRQRWIFNHRKWLTVDDFCEKCWNAI